MDALRYEYFIRAAWKKYLNRDIGKGEDPAKLACADICNLNSVEYLDEAISSTAYVMQMYKNYIINNEDTSLTEELIQQINAIIHQVITSTDINCIHQNIRDFESIIKKYNIENIG